VRVLESCSHRRVIISGIPGSKQDAAGGVVCLALAIALAQSHPFTPVQAVVALIVTAAARFLIPEARGSGAGRPRRLSTRPYPVIHLIFPQMCPL
jgi:hypothetical protein